MTASPAKVAMHDAEIANTISAAANRAMLLARKQRIIAMKGNNQKVGKIRFLLGAKVDFIPAEDVE